MKKMILFITLCVFILSFSGCAFNEKIVSVKQLKDKKVGVVVKNNADDLVLSLVPDAVIVEFDNINLAIKALEGNEIDALAYEEPILKNIAVKNPALTVLTERINTNSYVLGIHPDNSELHKQINASIKKMKSDLVYDEMIKRWFPQDGTAPEMARVPLSGENGKLVFGTCATSEPMSYYTNGNLAGFEIELARRIAADCGKSLDIVDMSYDKLIPQLTEKKVDFIGASISLGTLPQELVLAGDTYYEGGIGVMIKK